MGESLADVFVNTVRLRKPTTKPIPQEELLDALRNDFADTGEGLTGALFNHRGHDVELAFDTYDHADRLVMNGLRLPSGLKLTFKFVFNDDFDITFFNVPIHSNGLGEQQIVKDAGVKILSVHHVKRTFDGVDILTGERRFRCKGRSNLKPIPRTVQLYEGRILGCRYQGQALHLHRDRDFHRGTSALPNNVNWADNSQVTESKSVEDVFDEMIKATDNETEQPDGTATNENAEHPNDPANVEPAEPVEELETAGDDAKSPSAQQPPSAPLNAHSAPATPTKESTHPRRDKHAQSDDDRSRSPLKSTDCTHKCFVCTAVFTAVTEYQAHLKLNHKADFNVVYTSWLAFKKRDPEAYYVMKETQTCKTCTGVYLRPLPD